MQNDNQITSSMRLSDDDYLVYFRQRMLIISLLTVLFSFILGYDTSPVGDPPRPLPTPIHVRTEYGQSAAKLLLDESDYELSPTLQSSSASYFLTEAESIPAKVRTETNYQFRKRKRMEGLMKKEGKTAKEAEKIFLQRYSRYQKEWSRSNPEKRKKMNEKHIQKLEPNKIKKKRQEFPKRFHSHLRQRLKQGWSEQEAIQDAKKLIEKVRKSNRQSSERYRENKKAKIDRDASQTR